LVKHLTVLTNGTVALTDTTATVFAQSALLRELGLDVPVVVAVVEALRARGWPLPPGLLREADLVAALRKL